MDPLVRLDELHTSAGTYLDEYAAYVRPSQDTSGKYVYLELKWDDKSAPPGLRLGRYLETGWVFLDIPLRGSYDRHFVLARLMYNDQDKPDESLLKRAAEIIGHLDVDIHPVLVTK